jgi:bacteriophage holin
MKFNLKDQIKNRYFWLSIVSLVVLTAQQFNLDIIPVGFEDYVNTILTILVGMGILNNNSTDGLGE